MNVIRTRPAILGALVVGLAATGCGSSDDSGEGIVERANQAMAATSFHGKGTTTAVAGGTQEIWSDPRHGFRARITIGLDEPAGEILCRDGDAFMSTDLALESLRKAGGSGLEVPADLKSSYVRMPTTGGCASFYAIPESGKVDKKLAKDVTGVATTAVTATNGSTTDTYFVAATNKPYLLRLESNRSGHISSTTYDSFGTPVSITMPTPDKIVSMDDFRARVKAGQR
ncbi:hypothetical protein [Embleya sp. NBC_00896]|uniref:hypothetical protein n=1 Tax=Embleya sp. NBC_00896 TaxID=2975961 RepID=UPI002F9139EC|nr:hypothetical protein OG928_39500 [Embleya sp. NBC_00896]